ncbi:MAG TPA: hypothetical protein VK752_17165 [Bryobacteraceae bacterium]|nr:hypothetical protein [Bryobacteraceae bacterium]
MVTSLAVLLLGFPVFAQDNVNPQAAAILDFEKRIDDYVNLTKRLSKGIPVNEPTDQPHLILERQHELARKLREARKDVKQGAIFTPDIAKEFRRLLGIAMAAQKNNADIQKSLARAEPVRLLVRINEPYPPEVPLQSTPPTILLNLPRLPQQLEYRIAGHALVLRDTVANLVVDLIPDAIP